MDKSNLYKKIEKYTLNDSDKNISFKGLNNEQKVKLAKELTNRVNYNLEANKKEIESNITMNDMYSLQNEFFEKLRTLDNEKLGIMLEMYKQFLVLNPTSDGTKIIIKIIEDKLNNNLPAGLFVSDEDLQK